MSDVPNGRAEGRKKQRDVRKRPLQKTTERTVDNDLN